MKNFKLFLVLLILGFANSIYAYDGITFYGAEISAKDRYNTSGERLTTVKDILRQDRANFYLFGGDNSDQGDSYFSSKKHRELFETANISISPGLARRILSNEDVLISVFVNSPGEIDVQPGLPTPGVD